jgi:hypothetical protein
LSSTSLWRKRDMAVLNADGTPGASSSALIWGGLSSDSIFVWESFWGSGDFLVLAITFYGMFIVSQVADVKPKRHHLVMLGINLLVTTSLVKIFQQSSNGE